MSDHDLAGGAARAGGVSPDPIVEEVRKLRAEHASEFNYDLKAICEDLRQKQRDWGIKVVTRPAKRLTDLADAS